MRGDKAKLIELLYEALHSPLGLAVETNDPQRLRQALYAAMKADSDFASLALTPSRADPSGELWIIKKGQPNVGSTQEPGPAEGDT